MFSSFATINIGFGFDPFLIWERIFCNTVLVLNVITLNCIIQIRNPNILPIPLYKYRTLFSRLQDNYTFLSDYATMSRTLKEVL